MPQRLVTTDGLVPKCGVIWANTRFSFLRYFWGLSLKEICFSGPLGISIAKDTKFLVCCFGVLQYSTSFICCLVSQAAKTLSFQWVCSASKTSQVPLLSIDDYQLTLSELICISDTRNVWERRKAVFYSTHFTEKLQTNYCEVINFCCTVLDLRWWILHHPCHSFSRNLHLLSVCTQSPYMGPQHVMWLCTSLLSSFTMSSETVVQRELHHCFAEICYL